ncbi:MAG: NAD(P)-dependent glycerol-3-phosphate dehydrogenase [Desulfovibrio sp.]|jgi:glycerol-3-phosphate dehydrogenase (NAD(P)+)|nr:NAD(P)-dependent glycerol-3-phosphate dehydrogenase [Desulfovibrio sp.]
MRMTVLGGGSWGTALAHLAAGNGMDVTMLVRDGAQAEAVNNRHENPRYLPGLALNPGLRAVTDEKEALRAADLCLLAVPCQFLREVLREVGPLIPAHAIPVCASKGIEVASLKRMSEVVADELPAQAARYGILSGPSFAREVVQDKPTAVVLGCADAALGEKLRDIFSTPRFRVYSSTDVAGVETGGAVKNVMAIAAGLCDGLGLGDNARAALITRSLAEMSRLGKALGARGATFMGLSGMGDLVLTCAGDLSRNRQVGMRLAAGESLAHITGALGMVAEGVKTTEAVCRLGRLHGIELPIASAVHRVIIEGVPPLAMVGELMSRALRDE